MFLYVLIIFSKIIEVSLMTLRIVFITKGEKEKGALIGFFEVIIWLYIVSSVLTDISGDIFKVISYASGFALGNYFGVLLSSKLALGYQKIEIIVKEEDGDELATILRDFGIAVTVLTGDGKTCKRKILNMYIPRKKVASIIKETKAHQPNAVIISKEITPMYGGFGLNRK